MKRYRTARAIATTALQPDHTEILHEWATLTWMDPGHLPFPQPIAVYRSIDTLLRLHKAATWVKRECFLESAEQAGLRWRSTVRQQEPPSVSFLSFPPSTSPLAPQPEIQSGSIVEGGSFFDADHPSKWVIFACSFEITDANIDATCNRTL